ncbi:MAG: hypothetical protein DSZ08_02925 [Sulfurovum sp.]|nr:MAG: hypothetical protein DSZ08_02925 [Sulfurovum sp.]
MLSKKLVVSRNIQADFARSVEVDTNKKLIYLGDNSHIKIIDTADNDSVIGAENSSNGAIWDEWLSKDKSLLYVVDNKSFIIYNVSDKNHITKNVSLLAIGAKKLFISSDESIAVVKDASGVKLIDISNKKNISVMYEFKDSQYHTHAIALGKNTKRLYAIQANTFRIYDLNTLTHPKLLHAEDNFPLASLAVSHDEKKIFLANSGKVWIKNISDIDHVKNEFYYDLKEEFSGQTFITVFDDDKTFITTAKQNLRIFSIHNKRQMHITKAINNFSDLGPVKIINHLLYIPDGKNGLWILKK